MLLIWSRWPCLHKAFFCSSIIVDIGANRRSWLCSASSMPGKVLKSTFTLTFEMGRFTNKAMVEGRLSIWFQVGQHREVLRSKWCDKATNQGTTSVRRSNGSHMIRQLAILLLSFEQQRCGESCVLIDNPFVNFRVRLIEGHNCKCYKMWPLAMKTVRAWCTHTTSLLE